MTMMRGAIDASIAVSFVRRVAHGSLICRAVARAGCRVWLIVRGGAAAIARPTTPSRSFDDGPELARLVRVAESSRLISALDAAIELPARAWSASVAARLLAPLIGQVRALDLPHRVRLIGWMLVVAALTGGAVGGLRDSAVPALVIGFWAAVLALGFGLMAGARHVAAAWIDRAARRSMHRRALQ